jgi:hypothetical protein
VQSDNLNSNQPVRTSQLDHPISMPQFHHAIRGRPPDVAQGILGTQPSLNACIQQQAAENDLDSQHLRPSFWGRY